MEKNCWEFMECGREEGGRNVASMGICLAATEKRLDGVHGGINAERACWLISGTLCEGEAQGTFAHKDASCMYCDFYKLVEAEEKRDFKIALELVYLLND